MASVQIVMMLSLARASIDFAISGEPKTNSPRTLKSKSMMKKISIRKHKQFNKEEKKRSSRKCVCFNKTSEMK